MRHGAFAAALALAAAGFASGASAAGPADALVEPGSTLRHEGVADGAPVSAEVTGFGPTVLQDGGTLTAGVMIDNPTMTAVDEVTLVMSVTRDPLATLDAIERFLGSPDSVPVQEAAREPEPPAPPELAEDASGEDGEDAEGGDEESEAPEPPGVTVPGQSTISLAASAPAANLGLTPGAWGVHGIVLELEVGDDTYPVDTLVTTWADAPVPSLPVAALATAQGGANRVAAVLSEADVAGVAVAADPTSLTNALVLDSGLLERELLRLPGHTPDVTSLAHADDEEVLALAASMTGDTTLISTATPWIAAPAAVDATSVSHASAHGAAASVARPDAVGAEVVRDLSAGAVATVDGSPLLVPEPTLSATLAGYRPGSDAAASLLVAQSAVVAAEHVGAPALVSPGSSWQLGGDGPSRALEALMAAPWTQPMAVAELLDAEGADATLPTRIDADHDLAPDHVDALETRIRSLRTLASTTIDPADALADWGTPVVAAATETLRGEGTAREVAVAEGLAAADETLAAVRIAESSDLNLIADSGDVPITVINGVDRPVTVTVELTSTSPNLQVLGTPTIEVPAGEEAVATVPVEAVSSANVSVSVALRTADGEAVSDAQWFDIRVRADWGTAATAVFTVLLVLVMIAGIVRTVRRGRKDTRTRPGTAPATAPPTPQTPPEGRDGRRP